MDEVKHAPDGRNNFRANRIQIGDLIVDISRRRVTRDAVDLNLPALSFDLLVELARVAPATLSVSRLMDAVWPDLVVTPETVSQRVRLLRQVIGDDASSARYVASVRGRGYCLAAPIIELEPDTEGVPAAASAGDTSRLTTAVVPNQPSAFAALVVLKAAVWLMLVTMICVGPRQQVQAPPIGRYPPLLRTANDALIAVAPFADLSEARDQGYIAAGLTSEVSNLLSTIPDLKVVSPDSRSKSVGVLVLHGSVRRAGARIYVTTELVDTRDGSQRWSGAYDRSLLNLMDVQNEIAMDLARAVRIEIHSAAPPAATQRGASALDTYMRGLHAADRFDQQGFEQAAAAFRHSRELSPSFASPAQSLALTLGFATLFGFLPPAVGFEEARAAAIDALELAPDSAMPHAVLSLVHSGFDYDWSAAQREADMAVALEPNNSTILLVAAHESLATGRWGRALDQVDAALAIDPLNASAYMVGCWTYLRLERFAEAEAACRQALQVSPTYAFAHYELGVVLLTERKFAAAQEQMSGEINRGAQAAGLTLAYESRHEAKASKDALARLEVLNSGWWPMSIAAAHAVAGDKTQAFAWLRRALKQRDPGLQYIIGHPLLRSLESDPRYSQLLREMGLPSGKARAGPAEFAVLHSNVCE